MDEFQRLMRDALAEFLNIEPDRAGAAMEYMWQATKDYESGHPLSYVPDPGNAAVMLAQRIEHAVYEAVAADERDGVIVVVQEARTREIGVAIIGVPPGEAEFLLRLGIGSTRRSLRQARE